MDGRRPRRKVLKIVLPVLLAVALLAGGFFWYVGDYYHADGAALAALEGAGTVRVTHEKGCWSFDGPGDDAALVFYPGGKVEHTAYAPLLSRIAALGVDCFLVEMPFNLAVFGMDRADGVMAGHSYQRWYLGGHSLGGAMAASYAAKHPGKLNGLVLLGAYPTSPLPAEGFAVLSVCGSEDKVVNRDKLEAGRAFMPQRYTELWIAGGNHAWFGSYGEQAGDGTASVSREEQWEQTARAVADLALAG